MSINEEIPNILLVDEDTKRRQQLTSRLRTNAGINYKIEAGLGGFHCLHQVENNQFDLIILVEEFDDMSVQEVLSMLRHSMECQTAVLYLSKNDDLVRFREIFNLGANACEVLTDNFNDLLNSIKKLL